MDEGFERRQVLRGGATLVALLSGCGGVFVEEPKSTPEGTETDRPTSTPTPTATSTATPTATATPSPTPTLPSDLLTVRETDLSVSLGHYESYAFVDFEVQVEHVGERVIDQLEYRVDVRYEAPEISRVVATEYVSRQFPTGFKPGSKQTLDGRARFRRDGRAERSTDESRFSLELMFRRFETR